MSAAEFLSGVQHGDAIAASTGSMPLSEKFDGPGEESKEFEGNA
jgi:hypothetical protein